MALDDDIRVLSGVDLFGDFTQDQLRLLAFGAERTHLAAERRLYREDDVADCAYVVVSGRISLFRERDDERVEVGIAGPREILGDLALISDTQRLTGAAALTDAEVIRITRPIFRRILEEYPELAGKIQARIARNLQAMITRLEKIGSRFG